MVSSNKIITVDKKIRGTERERERESSGEEGDQRVVKKKSSVVCQLIVKRFTRVELVSL